MATVSFNSTMTLTRPIETVNIVLGFDEDYARGAAVALRSAADRTTMPIRAFVLANGLGLKTRERLQRSWADIDVTFIEVGPECVEHLPRGRSLVTHVNQSAWLRVFAADIVPPDCSRLLYLDADTLTVGDISELFSSDLHGHPVGAVIDTIERFDAPYGIETYRDLGFSGSEPYFNSGVLLVDTEQWRQDGASKKIIDLARSGSDWIRFADQDALNVVFADRWHPLPRVWNDQWLHFRDKIGKRESAERMLRRVKLVHFLSDEKPWRDNYRGPLGLALFDAVEQRTDWRGFGLEVTDDTIARSL